MPILTEVSFSDIMSLKSLALAEVSSLTTACKVCWVLFSFLVLTDISFCVILSLETVLLPALGVLTTACSVVGVARFPF